MGMGKVRAKVLGGPPNKEAPRPIWGEVIHTYAFSNKTRRSLSWYSGAYTHVAYHLTLCVAHMLSRRVKRLNASTTQADKTWV